MVKRTYMCRVIWFCQARQWVTCNAKALRFGCLVRGIHVSASGMGGMRWEVAGSEDDAANDLYEFIRSLNTP